MHNHVKNFKTLVTILILVLFSHAKFVFCSELESDYKTITLSEEFEKCLETGHEDNDRCRTKQHTPENGNKEDISEIKNKSLAFNRIKYAVIGAATIATLSWIYGFTAGYVDNPIHRNFLCRGPDRFLRFSNAIYPRGYHPQDIPTYQKRLGYSAFLMSPFLGGYNHGTRYY